MVVFALQVNENGSGGGGGGIGGLDASMIDQLNSLGDAKGVVARLNALEAMLERKDWEVVGAVLDGVCLSVTNAAGLEEQLERERVLAVQSEAAAFTRATTAAEERAAAAAERERVRVADDMAAAALAAEMDAQRRVREATARAAAERRLLSAEMGACEEEMDVMAADVADANERAEAAWLRANAAAEAGQSDVGLMKSQLAAARASLGDALNDNTVLLVELSQCEVSDEGWHVQLGAVRAERVDTEARLAAVGEQLSRLGDEKSACIRKLAEMEAELAALQERAGEDPAPLRQALADARVSETVNLSVFVAELELSEVACTLYQLAADEAIATSSASEEALQQAGEAVKEAAELKAGVRTDRLAQRFLGAASRAQHAARVDVALAEAAVARADADEQSVRARAALAALAACDEQLYEGHTVGREKLRTAHAEITRLHEVLSDYQELGVLPAGAGCERADPGSARGGGDATLEGEMRRRRSGLGHQDRSSLHSAGSWRGGAKPGAATSGMLHNTSRAGSASSRLSWSRPSTSEAGARPPVNWAEANARFASGDGPPPADTEVTPEVPKSRGFDTQSRAPRSAGAAMSGRLGLSRPNSPVSPAKRAAEGEHIPLPHTSLPLSILDDDPAAEPPSRPRSADGPAGAPPSSILPRTFLWEAPSRELPFDSEPSVGGTETLGIGERRRPTTGRPARRDASAPFVPANTPFRAREQQDILRHFEANLRVGGGPGISADNAQVRHGDRHSQTHTPPPTLPSAPPPTPPMPTLPWCHVLTHLSTPFDATWQVLLEEGALEAMVTSVSNDEELRLVATLIRRRIESLEEHNRRLLSLQGTRVGTPASGVREGAGGLDGVVPPPPRISTAPAAPGGTRGQAVPGEFGPPARATGAGACAVAAPTGVRALSSSPPPSGGVSVQTAALSGVTARKQEGEWGRRHAELILRMAYNQAGSNVAASAASAHASCGSVDGVASSPPRRAQTAIGTSRRDDGRGRMRPSASAGALPTALPNLSRPVTPTVRPLTPATGAMLSQGVLHPDSLIADTQKAISQAYRQQGTYDKGAGKMGTRGEHGPVGGMAATPLELRLEAMRSQPRALSREPPRAPGMVSLEKRTPPRAVGAYTATEMRGANAPPTAAMSTGSGRVERWR